MTDSSAAEYFLSAYLTPPGERSVISPRHDHNVSLWRRTAGRVELVRHCDKSASDHQVGDALTCEPSDRFRIFCCALVLL
ncbi:hypothetical protein ABZV31_32610 [Streptomyces sp. NPDC005202]|uniref:hypothetical protein n=1 Tax=Streptomyces sp. NPDC005202 TaxID=3157021 RepID=UPI0033B01C33